jgi:hypothetical protein
MRAQRIQRDRPAAAIAGHTPPAPVAGTKRAAHAGGMIPEEAVEVAAKALYRYGDYAAGWDELGGADGADGAEIQQSYRARARTALAAAGPFIAAQVLRDAATEIADANGGKGDGDKDYWDGYAEATQAAENILESRAESFDNAE